MLIVSVSFSILQIRTQQIRSAQFGADQTIPSYAILSRASLCVYVLQQHMAATCCQGSLSPGPASPALGQMAAHWALKSNCAAQDTRPAPALFSYLGSSCLPGGLFSYSASSHARTPECAGGLWFNLVSIQAEWKRELNKQNVPLTLTLSLSCGCRNFADNAKIRHSVENYSLTSKIK